MSREELVGRIQVAARMVRNGATDPGPRDEDSEIAVAALLDEAANCIMVQGREVDAAIGRNVLLVNELDEQARLWKLHKERNRRIAERLIKENEP